MRGRMTGTRIAQITLETAVEQRRREATKLGEKGVCAQSAARPPHPQGERGFLSEPIRLRAFAPLLFVPIAESKITTNLLVSIRAHP